MKRISKFLALLLVFSPGMLQAAPNLPEVQAKVETQLRSEFNLIDGPATEFASFHIPDVGYFIVLSTDFGMAATNQTPFGRQSTTSRVPAPDHIASVLGQTILSCKSEFADAAAGEVLALVVVHRPLFRSPARDAQEPSVYRSWIQISNLTAGKGEPDFLSQ